MLTVIGMAVVFLFLGLLVAMMKAIALVASKATSPSAAMRGDEGVRGREIAAAAAIALDNMRRQTARGAGADFGNK